MKFKSFFMYFIVDWNKSEQLEQIHKIKNVINFLKIENDFNSKNAIIMKIEDRTYFKWKIYGKLFAKF